MLTIHDLQYRTDPRVPHADEAALPRRAIPRSVGRAAVVAVPSEYVRGTVIDAYGIDPERVVVVPHGVEPTLGPTLRRRRSSAALRARGRPMLVYPAITHPHKNHRFLLELMARHWTDPDLRLVLLGGAAPPRTRWQRTSTGSGSTAGWSGRVGCPTPTATA